jgi:hypothetical protein
MELIYNNEPIVVINNHFKCCGDGIMDINDDWDQETRRFDASNLLKDFIDYYFPDSNVIVLGDLNDLLTDNSSNNVFRSIINDPANFRFTDMNIANGSIIDWSYPSWPSHLDHILVSNELFEEINHPDAEVSTIKIDEFLPGGWQEYYSNISDHRPVAQRFVFDLISGYEEVNPVELSVSNLPNPFSHSTQFFFAPVRETGRLIIYNTNGQEIERMKIREGQNSITWDSNGLDAGIYIARIISDNHYISERKIILMD